MGSEGCGAEKLTNVKPNPSRDRKGAFAGHAFSQRSLTGCPLGPALPGVRSTEYARIFSIGGCLREPPHFHVAHPDLRDGLIRVVLMVAVYGLRYHTGISR